MLDALLGDSEACGADELECVFIQVLYNSLGAAIVADDRKEFDSLIKKTAGFMTVEDSDTKFAGYREFLLKIFVKFVECSEKFEIIGFIGLLVFRDWLVFKVGCRFTGF